MPPRLGFAYSHGALLAVLCALYLLIQSYAHLIVSVLGASLHAYTDTYADTAQMYSYSGHPHSEAPCMRSVPPLILPLLIPPMAPITLDEIEAEPMA